MIPRISHGTTNGSHFDKLNSTPMEPKPPEPALPFRQEGIFDSKASSCPAGCHPLPYPGFPETWCYRIVSSNPGLCKLNHAVVFDLHAGPAFLYMLPIPTLRQAQCIASTSSVHPPWNPLGKPGELLANLAWTSFFWAQQKIFHARHAKITPSAKNFPSSTIPKLNRTFGNFIKPP